MYMICIIYIYICICVCVFIYVYSCRTRRSMSSFPCFESFILQRRETSRSTSDWSRWRSASSRNTAPRCRKLQVALVGNEVCRTWKWTWNKVNMFHGFYFVFFAYTLKWSWSGWWTTFVYISVCPCFLYFNVTPLRITLNRYCIDPNAAPKIAYTPLCPFVSVFFCHTSLGNGKDEHDSKAAPGHSLWLLVVFFFRGKWRNGNLSIFIIYHVNLYISIRT